MSHNKERIEKNCLNCGAEVQGRYCQVCGQENIEPKETFWHLLTHFFYDISHFDGKFFHSIKYLFTRPGFLAEEYLRGRRATYLNPIRMYVFTSAFFFLLFFSFLHEDTDVVETTTNGKTMSQIMDMDSTAFAKFTTEINVNDDKPALPMTRQQFRNYIDSSLQSTGIHFTRHHYNSVQEYDSLRKAGAVHDNWFERQFAYKEIYLNKKYHKDGKQVTKAFSAALMHSIPQMLFISLPLMALLLKLLYIRRRKQFYYINHAIFSIYFYIFLFLAMLLIFGLSTLNEELNLGFISFLIGIFSVGIFVYEYASLYKFYKQGWFKTFAKFILLNLLFAMVIGIVFVFFIFLSLFKI